MSAFPNGPLDKAVMPVAGSSITALRLAYAQIGWYTFPVHGIGDDGCCTCGKSKCNAPGKHPIFSGQDRGASIDTVRIRRDGIRHPRANIGLHLGLSKLVCIDVDPRNGGNETLARLEQEQGSLDASVVAETGGGGRHYFFRVSDAPLPRKGSLGSGIDVLHGTSYPVIAPSKHNSGGTYRWVSGCDPWEAVWLLGPLPGWVSEGADQRSIDTLDVTSDTLDVTSDDDDWVGDLPAGRPFDWTGANVAHLRSALTAIPADERDQWVRIGAALHQASAGSEEGRELWDEWSRGSPDFEGCPGKFEQWDQEGTWAGFDAERPGGITVGSIFYEAKQNGWAASLSDRDPDTMGDISNGRRFAARYRGEFLYVRGTKKWLRWDGLRWASCDSGQDVQAAKSLADTLVREAAKAFTDDPDDANKRRHGLALAVHRSIPRLHAILEAAKTEPGMNVPDPTALDCDPWMLGVRNGVLNLRTGKLQPARPEQRISKQAGASVDPSAKCPRWKAFLLEVFGTVDVVAFVQRLVGYSLTGFVDEEILIFMFGTGANGKSVFANVLTALFGEYAVTVGTELLARNKSEGETARYKVKLQGARLALANEVGQGDTWDDQRVKEITSREPIPARLLYGEAFSFMPTHTLWIRGNHQPTILDASDGMWRRIHMIPFALQIAPDKRIPDLDRQLVERESSGILAWAVRGCLKWQRDGLGAPPSIQSATQQYRSESDVLGLWLTERCTREPGARLGVGEAYAAWQEFCRNIGVSPGAQPMFTRRMKAKGERFQKSNGRGFFLDLTVRVADDFDDL